MEHVYNRRLDVEETDVLEQKRSRVSASKDVSIPLGVFAINSVGCVRNDGINQYHRTGALAGTHWSTSLRSVLSVCA